MRSEEFLGLIKDGADRKRYVDGLRKQQIPVALRSQRFLEIGWISAIADLKLSAAVEYIDCLTLTLSQKTLDVQFKGYRHRRYSNEDPYEINVSGKLELSM